MVKIDTLANYIWWRMKIDNTDPWRRYNIGREYLTGTFLRSTDIQNYVFEWEELQLQKICVDERTPKEIRDIISGTIIQ